MYGREYSVERNAKIRTRIVSDRLLAERFEQREMMDESVSPDAMQANYIFGRKLKVDGSDEIARHWRKIINDRQTMIFPSLISKYQRRQCCLSLFLRAQKGFSKSGKCDMMNTRIQLTINRF